MNTVSTPRSPARRGFTLIELLTVIAIIGILASILIPTVSRVRESARSANCVSNLRQIYLALRLYAEDNKGVLPASHRPKLPTESGTGTMVLWTKAVSTYLPVRGVTVTANEHPVFACPSAEINGKRGSQLSNTYTATAAIIGLTSGGDPTATATPRPLNTIDPNRPTQIPLIMEGKASNTTSATTNPSRTWSVASQDMGVSTYEETRHFDFRHNGRMNVCYVDGSVRSMEFPKFQQIDEGTYSGLADR